MAYSADYSIKDQDWLATNSSELIKLRAIIDFFVRPMAIFLSFTVIQLYRMYLFVGDSFFV